MPVLLAGSLHSDQFTCPECHAWCCGPSLGGGRHNAIRDVVFNAAQSAALGPSKETPGLVPDSASCPADVLLTNRRPVALDVHVISPFQSLTLSEAARTHAWPCSPSGRPT